MIVFLVMAGRPGAERCILVASDVSHAVAQMEVYRAGHPAHDAFIQPAQVDQPVVPGDAVYPVEGLA